MQGFEKWCQQHANKFGLQTQADRDMLLAWEPVFDRAGFTLEELMKASETIALKPPKWRSEHLPRILETVRGDYSKRERDLTEEQRAEQDTCPDCKGSGYVSVPHPRCVVDGRWEARGKTFYTAVVCCSCLKGEAVHQRMDKLPTIDEYAIRCPNWRAIMRERDKERIEQSKLRKKAGSLDKELGPIMQGLTENIGKEGSIKLHEPKDWVR